MSLQFLSADWNHVCLFNYAVDRRLLEPYLPPQVELDLWRGDAYLSLVAFDFLNTRVGGIGWPGFRNFPEINLRFYVKHHDRRGVVFIREFVPKRFIAWTARTLYNEPYLATPMQSTVTTTEQTLIVEHSLKSPHKMNTLRIQAQNTQTLPSESSIEHHFKEHQWGFGRNHQNGLSIYEVRHPIWPIYPVTNFELDWDWTDVYGPSWSPMNTQKPNSVFLAHGSPVEVFWPVNSGPSRDDRR